MGRYDKIKVWDGNSWRTPTQIKVYRSGWQDLGTATSDSTRPLYVYKESEHVLKRATLNRRDYTTIVDQYTTGQFKLKPASGYCYATNSSNVPKIKWDLNVTIRKTQDIDQTVFVCGHSNESSGSYIKVKWLANGKIKVYNQYKGGSDDTLTSSNAVMAGNWVTLHVYTNKSSSTCHIVFNDVDTHGTLNNFFQYIDCRTLVGDTYINFKNTFTASGSKYNGKAYTCQFNASTASGTGTDTATYQNVTHYEETQSHTVYE